MGVNLTKSQRSYCMSQVKNTGTDIEQAVWSSLKKRRLPFETNSKHLPGKPDVVFPRAMVAVFIDGDFWHGYRFPNWRDQVSEFWQTKIEINRRRDQRNFRKLRRLGWRVVRVWQHQVEQDLESCVDRIKTVIQSHSQSGVA